MNDIIFTIITVVLFIGTLLFIWFMNDKRDKAEKDRLREVVLAIKSKDVEQYSLVLPPEEDKRIEKPADEIFPLEEVLPEELLRAEK